jgi:hypothetical protein
MALSRLRISRRGAGSLEHATNVGGRRSNATANSLVRIVLSTAMVSNATIFLGL